jgi:hypothetical protein|tara:strand:+ start:130 stop:528 length:399 start_codon:yes stop_codon:yes gene_type:complete
MIFNSTNDGVDMRFSNLTNGNYMMYGLLHYDNPYCKDIKEFFEDIKRIHYINRLFKRYKLDSVLKERMILNHLIIFYNVFENKAATRILFFKVNKDYHSYLKTFLIYINKMPDDRHDIPLDEYIVKTLRGIR